MDPKRAMLEGKNTIFLFRKLSEANIEVIMLKDGTSRKLSE